MRISDWSSDVCSSDLLVLNGRRMTKGQNVMCSMTAANRDPEAFDDPDTLRFDRKPANSGGLRNMTFGTGRRPVSGGDRKSVVWGKSVSVRVGLGGRRVVKKKKQRRIARKTGIQ